MTTDPNAADDATAEAGRALEAAAHAGTPAPPPPPPPAAPLAPPPVAPREGDPAVSGTLGPAPGPAPVTAGPRSRGWVGVLVVGVVMALLLGVNGVLFVRVRDAQAASDRAARSATLEAQLAARLDALDRQVRSIDSSQVDAAGQVAAVGKDVTALRKCVNDAVDGIAKAVATGKAGTVSKC